MLTLKPRGTNDFLPGEVEEWQGLEARLQKLFHIYNYHEIRTPILEHTELFLRSVGETSDIVEKEMYSFEDKGFRHLTLRPEGTAGTVRAFMENKLFSGSLPKKLYYMGPMFRYDQPQAGRYRQFHQFGCEVFGSEDASVDAEVIAFSLDLFSRLGLKELQVRLNTVGCPKCRPGYLQALKDYFSEYKAELCLTCQRRLESNPLRILDCKEEACARLSEDAPTSLEYACDDCTEHFRQLRAYLDTIGTEYLLDHRLVRGLDYYTQTAFEVVSLAVGSSQNAICGGGRYNKLAYEIGGRDLPGMGFAAGTERLLLTLKEQGIELGKKAHPEVFIAPLGFNARVKAFALLEELRKADIPADMDLMAKSLKAQMKTADRFNASYTVILGDDDLEKGTAVLRHMDSAQQEDVLLDTLIDTIKKGLEHVSY